MHPSRMLHCDTLDTTVEPVKRQALATDGKIGAGNFLWHALAVSPNPDADILFLEKPYRSIRDLDLPVVRKKSGKLYHKLSLSLLKQECDFYAAWYCQRGVKPKDPVAIYLDDGIEYLIHYLALTALGAIPVLTNGNLSPDIAAQYFSRVGVVGLLVDAAHKAALQPFLPADQASFFMVSAQDIGAELVCGVKLKQQLPLSYPYSHQDLDPIMIAHSSGTTGVPKAVLLQHQAFFHGVRYRLAVPSTGGPERILSALPHSHNCAMAYIMLALLCGNHVYITSDHSGANLALKIAAFKPSMVVAFPQTYVEFTEVDVDASAMKSVRYWFNGGDAAHEQHIRALVALGSHFENNELIDGSLFIDGMGSSEMGFSLFRHVHDKLSDDYDRCVGTPAPWAAAAVIGDDDSELEPGKIGRLAVKAASVTTGYWNNSLLSFRSQVAGYWLTGDLAYRDTTGRFYHVDRIPDLIQTATGPVYSLATEELLLKKFAFIADCSVIAVTDPASSERSYQAPLALVRLRRGTVTPSTPEKLLQRFNDVLQAKGWGLLAAVKLATPDDIPLGTTGKVLKRQLRDIYRDYLSTLKTKNTSHKLPRKESPAQSLGGLS